MNLLAAWAELDVARHKAELYRMWHAGCHAGLPHHTVLEHAGDFSRSPTVRRVRDALRAGLTRRATITAVVTANPVLFVPFEAALLELGEESGRLEECLRLLAGYFAAEHRMITWLKKKLTYPMFNALAAVVIGPLPLVFMGRTGAYLLSAGGGLVLCVAAGGGLLLAAARRYSRRPTPVRARLARALATGVEAGLGLDRVVDLAVQAAANPEIAIHVAGIPRTARMGQPLARTFAGCPAIPHEMLSVMEVADTTGNYTDTLRRLADLYDGALR
jgi:type II secretory pathway component PulF